MKQHIDFLAIKSILLFSKVKLTIIFVWANCNIKKSINKLESSMGPHNRYQLTHNGKLIQT